MSSTDNDNQLLSALLADSQDAFKQVCLTYTHTLYAYCYSYTRNSAYTEEVVQDILVAFWNYRHRLTLDSSIKSVLFTIARHHAINAFRTTLRSPVYEDYVKYSEAIACDANDKLGYDDFLVNLRHAMNRLTRSEKKVVELSKFEHYSNSEIAESLGISEKTVRNQLSAGLSKLRMYLTDFKYIVLLFINI